MTPAPSFSIIRIAECSWGPQSHRRDPKTSPVRHSLWTRTMTARLPVAPGVQTFRRRQSSPIGPLPVSASPISTGRSGSIGVPAEPSFSSTA